MLGSSIFSALMQIVFKPQIIFPIIVLILASAAASEVGGFMLDKPLNDLLIYSGSAQPSSPIGLFLLNYPLELLELFVLGSVMFAIGIIAFMSVSRMANEEGFFESINKSVLEGSKTIGLVILLWAIFVVAAGAFTLASAISSLESTIGLVVSIIFAIIIFIAFVKLIFVFPALIKNDLKSALQASWKFTDKKFWGSLALIIIAGFIAFVIGLILTQIGIMIGDIWDPILSSLGDVIGISFFIAAVTNYFYSKQK